MVMKMVVVEGMAMVEAVVMVEVVVLRVDMLEGMVRVEEVDRR